MQYAVRPYQLVSSILRRKYQDRLQYLWLIISSSETEERHCQGNKWEYGISIFSEVTMICTDMIRTKDIIRNEMSRLA